MRLVPDSPVIPSISPQDDLDDNDTPFAVARGVINGSLLRQTVDVADLRHQLPLPSLAAENHDSAI